MIQLGQGKLVVFYLYVELFTNVMADLVGFRVFFSLC